MHTHAHVSTLRHTHSVTHTHTRTHAHTHTHSYTHTTHTLNASLCSLIKPLPTEGAAAAVSFGWHSDRPAVTVRPLHHLVRMGLILRQVTVTASPPGEDGTDTVTGNSHCQSPAPPGEHGTDTVTGNSHCQPPAPPGEDGTDTVTGNTVTASPPGEDGTDTVTGNSHCQPTWWGWDWYCDR